MDVQNYREIPYNFTSADDRLIIRHLFGPAVWEDLEELRSQRQTGRSSRLMMRCIGDLFLLQRNPFVYEELIDSPRRRFIFFRTMRTDLHRIEQTARKLNVDQRRTDQVLNLVALCQQQARDLQQEISQARRRRRQIRRQLGAVIGQENVLFDPFARISHATDATDWRLHLPLVVVRPAAEEQLPALLQAIAALGLHAIPRGGGTGLTGGAVPLAPDCVLINTEKLNRIRGIVPQEFTGDDGERRTLSVLRLEAGVITQDAMAYAEAQGLVFATDPTSAWASTIGGNIAENAGGKTAVLWGTAIDNLLTWTIAMPAAPGLPAMTGGELLTVRRIGHPMRKILPGDHLRYELRNQAGTLLRELELPAGEIRRPGLWKDITNKALGGLPGVQKEGTDGVITSAEFILYPSYPRKLTCCLEFFGPDMEEASRVIVAISEEFINQGEEVLMALEHFDEQYIRAINYKFKAARSEPPKAVLLIDMAAHTSAQILRGRDRLRHLLVPYQNTELFIAGDADEATRFWRDRKRLGAIAARTNAFKLNEDIVLPLPALAAFTRFVEEKNQAEDCANQEEAIREMLAYLQVAEPIEDPDWLEAKQPKAEELCRKTLAALAEPLPATLRPRGAEPLQGLLAELLELFQGFARISDTLRRIVNERRSKMIIIATHMHAGDGNVHVNIPVFSNDRPMMQRASQVADEVMAQAVALEGVVSGEHGIGITKIKFLDAERIEALRNYRRSVDPAGLMNPGKLDDPTILDKAFTPSFNLLSLEARILQHHSLESLAGRISKCVRCGKCKADCCVFYPGGNLFFHPRNKNLAIGALLEALLYDMQRSHRPRFTRLKKLANIADHCTLCGKCAKPCPVDIDTAQVSILERGILAERGYKKSSLPTWLSLQYLHSRNAALNAVFRRLVLHWGSAAQRLAAGLWGRLRTDKERTRGRLSGLLGSPMMPPSAHTLRQLLPRTEAGEALVLHPAKPNGKTVFYFPGCGSERLYGDIAMASVSLLLQSGLRVVLPPANLCCGFPAQANAKLAMHGEITLRDAIILSQIREMLGYFNFAAVLISCGTCREALYNLGVEEIFDCRLEDISRFVLDAAPERFADQSQPLRLYHAPCHDSLDGEGPLMARRLGASVLTVGNCCSEAGTLALSRPDIAGAMLQRKRELLAEASGELPRPLTVLTNCPSCLSGLGRNRELGFVPQHLAVLLAEQMGGPNWAAALPELLTHCEMVAF